MSLTVHSYVESAGGEMILREIGLKTTDWGCRNVR